MNFYDNIVYIEEIMAINNLLKGELKAVENATIVVSDYKLMNIKMEFKNCKFLFVDKNIIQELYITQSFKDSVHFICMFFPQEDLGVDKFWRQGECFKQNRLKDVYNDVLEGKFSIYIPNISITANDITVQDMGFNDFFKKDMVKKPKLRLNGKNVIIYNQENYQIIKG